MPKFKVVGYPDEENIYHGHHTRREEWVVDAATREEAERKGFAHFYYFHEVGVYEIFEPPVKLKVGDKIVVQKSNNEEDVVTGTITFVGDDNNTRYTYTTKICTCEDIIYDWYWENGRIKSVNGKPIK